ncbi:MAG TPA: DNA-directed RNA polymerase subunit alpha [Candidatus Moranbacteria bacterium]|nr:DNA-directed RNA polymerase subunit alpha [Candidatus Moranbacteria bacterium]
MQGVSLPLKPKYTKVDEATGKFEINGCYPGYGMTIGNAIRRVLLSSLEGAAVTAVKIKGVSHEFSTLEGVMEDVVQIVLNLKKVRFRMHGEEPMRATIKFKGEGPVTAKEIKCPSGLEVVSTDQLIATVTDKKVEFEMELEITKGLGYVPVEQQVRENKEIGVIAVDAVYTPMRRVNYNVENMRVGKRTDYNKVTFEIVTDGSISPEEAFTKAIKILVEQFSALIGLEAVVEEEISEAEVEIPAEKEAVAAAKEEEIDPLKVKVAELRGVSTRTVNVLEAQKVAKVKDVIKHTEEELLEIEGMGEKGIKELKKAIGEFGLTLKQK